MKEPDKELNFEAALEYLQQEMSGATFVSFIKPLTPVYIDELRNTLVLSAPDEEVKDMVEDKYDTFIKRAVKFASEGKFDGQIKIIIDEEFEDEIK